MISAILTFSFRQEIADVTETLTRLEGLLTAIEDKNVDDDRNLSILERSAHSLNLSLTDLARQLDALKNANVLGECATSDLT